MRAFESVLESLLKHFDEHGGATTETVRALAGVITEAALRQARAELGGPTYHHSAEAVVERIRSLPLGDAAEVVEQAFAVARADALAQAIQRIPRLPWDAHFMLEAAVAATRSTCDRGPELFLDPGRHGVGAVFVRDKRVVAGGFNGSPPGEPHCGDPKYRCRKCGATAETKDGIEHRSVRHWQVGENVSDPPLGDDYFVGEYGGHLLRDGHCVRTLHAEENALLQCALDGVSPKGATVYTTAGPCYDCAKRLVRAGVVRVVYGEPYDSRYGLSGEEATGLLLRAGIRVDRLEIADFVGGER